MNEKKYNVIYADPPWQYESKKIGMTGSGGAEMKYSTMSLDELKKMNIPGIIQDQSLCFMWATVPLLTEAIELLNAWGFRYKTMIVWEKTGVFGMGHWLRIQTEFIIVGVRGKPRPFKHQEKNIYRYPVCGHSAKPDIFRKLVVELSLKSMNSFTGLELFARSREGMFSDYEYEGWDVFGNQVKNSIVL